MPDKNAEAAKLRNLVEGIRKLQASDPACFLFLEYNLVSQLIAIKGALQRNRQADEAVGTRIKALDEQFAEAATGEYAMQLEDRRSDEIFGAFFQDAAHSMSAVGMLAPFIEALFVMIFGHLRDQQKYSASEISDPRTIALNQLWDPHFKFDKQGDRQKDIVAGIIQLSKFSDLNEFLPERHEETLAALFAYRNKMFHNGLVWPEKERQNFAKTIQDKRWPSGWFYLTRHGDEPWMFYMSATFIEHCLEYIDQVFEGFGKYLMQKGKI